MRKVIMLVTVVSFIMLGLAMLILRQPTEKVCERSTVSQEAMCRVKVGEQFIAYKRSGYGLSIGGIFPRVFGWDPSIVEYSGEEGRFSFKAVKRGETIIWIVPHIRSDEELSKMSPDELRRIAYKKIRVIVE